MPLEGRVQAQRCLTAAHLRCERFLGHAARAGRPAGARVLGDGFVSTRLVVAPEPAWRGFAGRARRAPRGPLLATGLAVAALGAGSVAIAAAIADGRLVLDLAIAEAEPSTTAAASTTSAVPTPSPAPETPAPTATIAAATPTVAASPSPVATPLPTIAPTAVPTQRTYVVQEGDTLAAIAQAFATSVEAIQAANDIEDPDEIFVGQVLVIP